MLLICKLCPSSGASIICTHAVLIKGECEALTKSFSSIFLDEKEGSLGTSKVQASEACEARSLEIKELNFLNVARQRSQRIVPYSGFTEAA